MNRYRVFRGIAAIGAGQVLGLSGAQIKPRVHALELPAGYETKAKDLKSKPPAFKDAVVRAIAPLQFIVGEVFGMPELPQHLVGIVEPLDQPKSEIDTMAVDKALELQDPKAHAAKVKATRKAAAEAKAAKSKAAR